MARSCGGEPAPAAGGDRRPRCRPLLAVARPRVGPGAGREAVAGDFRCGVGRRGASKNARAAKQSAGRAHNVAMATPRVVVPDVRS